MGIKAQSLVKGYLSHNGSINMSVDGSVSPVEFSYQASGNRSLKVQRIIIYLEGSTALNSDEFGNITALTNGVSVRVNGIEVENFKDNIDMVTCMFDTPGRANFGKETNTLTGRWTLTKDSAGNAISVEPGDTVSFVIQDDLSSIVHFRAKVGGFT